VIGHIAAQGVGRYRKGPLTESIRDYFLDESLPFPEGLNAFYWAYPHRPHVMARDAAYLDVPSGQAFAVWFLKFFPVAFLVTWGAPVGLEYEVHSFEAWRSLSPSQTVEMPLTLRPTPPAYWPEAPTDRSVLLYGREAVHAAV
jgi:hypothetical protein